MHLASIFALSTIRAPMRTEHKFMLTYPEYVYLRERIIDMLPVDPHVGSNKAYPVFSKYFDTPELDFFYQKINGEFDHVKIRIRQYQRELSKHTPGFIEAKVKYKFDQQKYRIAFDKLGDLDDPHSWPLDHPYFQSLIWQTGLAPLCNVYYEREVYEGTIGASNVRLNFDTNVLFLNHYENLVTAEALSTRQMLRDFYAVLEIKCNEHDLPEEIFEQLKAVNAERSTFSKYANAIEFLAAQRGYCEVV